MGDFHGLIAWQKARDLAVDVYRLTAQFPRIEQFGLVTQMRRSAVSVSSNLAEGSGRGSTTAFKSFARIARGSLSELRTQLEIAVAIDAAPAETAATVEAKCDELSRIISGLLR